MFYGLCLRCESWFSGAKLAALYKAYRPQYPDGFVRRVLDGVQKLTSANNVKHDVITSGRELAVDVGCGSGQLTSVLAPYYNDVIGLDVSDAQIEQAEKVNRLRNVRYCVAKSEILPLENSSVDLITAAQCVHWFDASAFYREVKRVLKPNGCLSVSFYDPVPTLFYANTEISRKLNGVYRSFANIFRDGGYLGARPEKAIFHRDELFDEIPFRNRLRDVGFSMSHHLTVKELCGYMSSKTYYARYMAQNPSSDILAKLEYDLLEIVSDSDKTSNDVALLATFKFDILTSCKS